MSLHHQHASCLGLNFKKFYFIGYFIQWRGLSHVHKQLLQKVATPVWLGRFFHHMPFLTYFEQNTQKELLLHLFFHSTHENHLTNPFLIFLLHDWFLDDICSFRSTTFFLWCSSVWWICCVISSVEAKHQDTSTLCSVCGIFRFFCFFIVSHSCAHIGTHVSVANTELQTVATIVCIFSSLCKEKLQNYKTKHSRNLQILAKIICHIFKT